MVVTVTIENRGKPGSLPVNLIINGIPEGEQIIYLNFSEEKDIKFNIMKEELGEYKVRLNNSDLSKIFFVTSKEEITKKKKEEVVEKKEEGISKLYMIVGLSILTILILVAKIYLRKKH